MSDPNIYAAEYEYDDEDPEGYRGGAALVGAQAGAKELALKLFELPAGQALCPYHYEYVEEWLILLEGELTLRTPDGERELDRGAVVCFPAGPAGAHKVWTRGETTARFLMFSRDATPAVAVYPDSDKVGLWGPDTRWLFRGAEANLEYYDGEV